MIDAGTPAREIAVLFRINAQSEAFEEALAARGVPYVLRRRGPVLRARRGQAGRHAAARQRPQRRRAPAPSLVDGRPGRAGRHGLDRRSRPPAAATSGTAGSRCRRSCRRPRSFLAARPEADAGRLRRRARPPRRRAARTGRRGRHAGDAARRQGPRVGRRVRGRHARGHDADHLRRHPRRGRGGAPAALRRHDPRPAAPARCPGRWPAPRAAAPRASRRGSSTGLRPQTASDSRPERGSSARKRKSVAHCRECGKPLGTTAERKVGRCEDCPASYDEELFERLRAWRVERAGQEKVPAYVVFTDLTLQAIAEVKPANPQSLLRINGIGAVQAHEVRRRRAHPRRRRDRRALDDGQATLDEA